MTAPRDYRGGGSVRCHGDALPPSGLVVVLSPRCGADGWSWGWSDRIQGESLGACRRAALRDALAAYRTSLPPAPMESLP